MGTEDEVSDNGYTTACAHQRVKYDPFTYSDGSMSDRWACVDCKHRFIPVAAAKAPEPERVVFCPVYLAEVNPSLLAPAASPVTEEATPEEEIDPTTMEFLSEWLDPKSTFGAPAAPILPKESGDPAESNKPPIPERWEGPYAQCCEFLESPGYPSDVAIRWCKDILEELAMAEERIRQLKSTVDLLNRSWEIVRETSEEERLRAESAEARIQLEPHTVTGDPPIPEDLADIYAIAKEKVKTDDDHLLLDGTIQSLYELLEQTGRIHDIESADLYCTVDDLLADLEKAESKKAELESKLAAAEQRLAQMHESAEWYKQTTREQVAAHDLEVRRTALEEAAKFFDHIDLIRGKSVTEAIRALIAQEPPETETKP